MTPNDGMGTMDDNPEEQWTGEQLPMKAPLADEPVEDNTHLPHEPGPTCTDECGHSEVDEVREAVVKGVPASAYRDRDVTGETWAWTTPRGQYRLMYSVIPERAVVLEFKVTEKRQDRIQMLVSVRNPSVQDVEDYILSPLVHVLDPSAHLY